MILGYNILIHKKSKNLICKFLQFLGQHNFFLIENLLKISSSFLGFETEFIQFSAQKRKYFEDLGLIKRSFNPSHFIINISPTNSRKLNEIK
jgi:hypothetical protein